VSEIVLDKLNLKGMRALDIGCGTGELLRQLASRGFDVTGVDLSDVAIKKAQAHTGTYIVGDFMDVSLPAKYDVIFINKVLAFANDKQAFLDKAKSLLSKNGKIVIITSILRSEYEDNYSPRLKSISVDIKQLESLLSKGWEQVSSRYFEDYGEELTIAFAK
jgi:SAM-dependent methyltransferase